VLFKPVMQPLEIRVVYEQGNKLGPNKNKCLNKNKKNMLCLLRWKCYVDYEIWCVL